MAAVAERLTVDRPVAPLALAAFEALEESGAAWCLLRGEHELAAPADLDILVAASGERRAASALREHAFVGLPSWGRWPHRQFVAFDVHEGTWLKVDLVVALAFGPDHALTSAAADGVLSRRRRTREWWAPSPDDAFWTLLVHCLLDDGRITGAHAEKLRRLAWSASGYSRLAADVERACPPGWTTGSMVAAAARGSFEELEWLAAALAARWPRRRHALPRATARLLRHAAALRRPGLSVALLGPDGAGKSTLAPVLASALPVPGRMLYAGLAPAGERSSGVRGLRLARRLLRLRRAALASWWHRARGRVVVFDRHPCEALAPPLVPLGRRSRLRRALLARACPLPDVTLLLDAPGDVLYRRKGEHDPVSLDAQRRRLSELAPRLPDVVRVDTSRSHAAVRAHAVAAVWIRYAARLEGRRQQ